MQFTSADWYTRGSNTAHSNLKQIYAKCLNNLGTRVRLYEVLDFPFFSKLSTQDK